MFKKEFYKFREFLYVFIALIISFLIYIAFILRNFVISNDAVVLNLGVLYTKNFSFFGLDVLNIIFAFVIGVLVFSKERISARLRISLHFPNSILKNISHIVLVGFFCIILVYLLEFIVFNLICKIYFHNELIKLINSHLIFSCLFGLNLYLMCGSVIIEPIKKRAIVNALFTLAVFFLYSEFNPNISEIPSFYYNQNSGFYLLLSFIYAICTLSIAFENYKKGYIK
ncbi:Uncharacterised protein [Campylobacter sputorum subsp. bubulus]|uniref:Uncharacterized protein n=1 Tax=Campylobacter sputorum subsp. sputorum TaxID=32024 RepID=A0A381DK95_9BACT|nr:hypothetical protein [Campylobacter sputorum]ASM35916.1 putative membrane protein [Campylobacter sputorum aubsp. sputorum RM3237]ASM39264.1 putative membrane protein [Campylobacter sputorum bv. paraureolyticus LMG 11764]KAB0582349.1 hypothetical protein F7P64_03515 [Campylobacter sputorum subsp. sputorum]MDY6121384.1 hypothetical protein [Campylobacter sputorum]QEL06106.1 putative membrane protein [Campylobacter sputorum subsp. sputorum]